MSGVPQGLWELLDGYLSAEGLELDDLQLAGQGGGRLLRVTVDEAGGVDVDRLAQTSRGLARLLDQHASFQQRYTLEVTSPGLERELRRPAHYRKAVGRQVVVKTHEPVDGARSHRGTLEAVDDESCVISIGDTRRRLPLAAIASARTVFVWEPAARPGTKGRQEG